MDPVQQGCPKEAVLLDLMAQSADLNKFNRHASSFGKPFHRAQWSSDSGAQNHWGTLAKMQLQVLSYTEKPGSLCS